MFLTVSVVVSDSMVMHAMVDVGCLGKFNKVGLYSIICPNFKTHSLASFLGTPTFHLYSSVLSTPIAFA